MEFEDRYFEKFKKAYFFPKKEKGREMFNTLFSPRKVKKPVNLRMFQVFFRVFSLMPFVLNVNFSLILGLR